MNLARLKKNTDYDDTIMTAEEALKVEAIQKRNIWIPLEDAEAHFRVIDKMGEYENV